MTGEDQTCQHQENCPRDDHLCTEKCDACRLITTIDHGDIYVCLLEDVEVIPVEIDLTPGYGQ